MAEPTPGGHALIARLAAAFPDHEAGFTNALQWMWANAEDLRVRAALGIALARRGEKHAYADAILADLFDDLHARPGTEG